MRSPARAAEVFDALELPSQIEDTAEGVRTIVVRLPVERAAAQLEGHYPGFPILPGVLLIDAVRQVAESAQGTRLRLCGIERARFVRPLLPGDEVELTVSVSSRTDRLIRALAKGVRADGEAAAELSVTLEPVVVDA
ncbi:3-hydroxyacyl-ACP dehydratase FabZ family protein [Mycobacteroides abscessus]|uniref:3-hydroxyacyl-ACP dehydratase FabZ family protein n=1 Tax=Mycobacteroides abscessus TaxID=36809 RepID=UPI0012FFDA82|nr:hypothetical protein [Mycobacteroides abscessus]